MPDSEWRALHDALGIPGDFAAGRELPEYEEAADLVEVGPNLVGRMQRLTPLAAERWQAMQRAAASDSVRLLIVPGIAACSTRPS